MADPGDEVAPEPVQLALRLSAACNCVAMLLKSAARAATSSRPPMETRVWKRPCATAIGAALLKAAMRPVISSVKKYPTTMAMPLAKMSRMMASVRSCWLMNMSRAVHQTLTKVSRLEST